MKVLLLIVLLVSCISYQFMFYSLVFVVSALEALVEKRITGFPVIDDNWKLVISLTF